MHVQPAEDRFLRITTHQADLGSVEECQRLLEHVRKRHGRSVDILVNNAGITRIKRDIVDIELEDWDAVVKVNLTAPFVLTKGVVPGMKEKRWGRIGEFMGLSLCCDARSC